MNSAKSSSVQTVQLMNLRDGVRNEIRFIEDCLRNGAVLDSDRLDDDSFIMLQERHEKLLVWESDLNAQIHVLSSRYGTVEKIFDVLTWLVLVLGSLALFVVALTALAIKLSQLAFVSQQVCVREKSVGQETLCVLRCQIEPARLDFEFFSTVSIVAVSRVLESNLRVG